MLVTKSSSSSSSGGGGNFYFPQIISHNARYIMLKSLSISFENTHTRMPEDLTVE